MPAGRAVVNLDSAPAIGVKNGSLGTVEEAQPQRFVVRLDDGRRVGFDPAQYSAVAHGYAVTIHKSQGATVDRAYALADPAMGRHATYVALTRHREAVHLFADRQRFADRDGLDKALSRASRKDLAQDYAAADLGRIAARVRTRPLDKEIPRAALTDAFLPGGLGALITVRLLYPRQAPSFWYLLRLVFSHALGGPA